MTDTAGLPKAKWLNVGRWRGGQLSIVFPKTVLSTSMLANAQIPGQTKVTAVCAGFWGPRWTEMEG